MRNNEGIVVELIGSSGSGKTTLGQALALGLLEDGIPSVFIKQADYDFSHKTVWSRWVFRTLANIVFVVILTLRLNLKKNRFDVLLWKRSIFTSVRTALNISFALINHKDKVSIIEPGYLMLLLNACMYKEKPIPIGKLNKFLKRLCHADVLIYISVDSNTSLNRIKSRERGEPLRMKGCSEHIKKRIIEVCDTNAKNIVSHCLQKDMLVLTVDGSKPIDEIVINIINKFEQYFK